MLRVFGCMCMALVPKHLRHNKLGAKAIWAVHLGMAQNSKGWLLWDPFTKKFLLPLELSSGSTTTRQSSLVNGGEEAKDAEEEEEEVQQVSERAPTLPSRTTSAPRIRVTPQQRQGLHVPAAEEEGRGKRRIQAPNRLTYDALGKPAKSALAGAALIIGEDEESDYEECAFAFFSPVEMPGEPATLKEALESSDAEEWKKTMESELKSIEENGTWELVELPEGRKAITSKWLFKIKSDADGKIERYKSRLDAVRSACVAKNRALTHVGANKWVPYVEWIGKKPKVDMLRVFGCMCMALVPKHLRHNKLGAKAIWAVHLGMTQNSKG
ncbi:unnamed protein product [Closterium sp. NIES-53]